jgi:formate hydrogenlyase subunit 3/multisubunit Na+/H+ antiporter MnhD subunit
VVYILTESNDNPSVIAAAASTLPDVLLPVALRRGGAALPASFSSLQICLALLSAWLCVGVAGLIRPGSVRFAGRTLFPLGAAVATALAVTAGISLGSPVETLVLPLGLPGLPMHVRLDALSAVFLLLLGATSAAISVFSAGYFRQGEGALPGLLCLEYHAFLAAMGLVLIADDAYTFMVAWESMALSSYFLVTTQHRLPEIRRAGFLYLLIAHVGALGILLSFGVLQGGSWQFTFDAMRAAHLSPAWASAAFGLALFGFGAKAGLVPLHVWLPEAHPAAPSPVSALMSGVMLKTAVYGFLRVTFDLLGTQLWWWGLVVLGFGLLSAFYGVIFAAVQIDMKRLLAWSSIENLGIAFSGIGLAIIFRGSGFEPLAALALVATLYHCLNHAVMKSLLFLGTGSVLHATGQRNLGRLGGLIHRMPWVAWTTLVGALAIAGLPPLNGFVSEWLLLQAFLFAGDVPHPFANMLLPAGAAIIALCAALAGYVMVKFYGVIFLGQPREASLATARDAGTAERVGLGALALGCVALGLLPAQIVPILDRAVAGLLHSAPARWTGPWWLLAPETARNASYGSPALCALLIIAAGITLYGVRRVYHRSVRRGPAWDCGHGRNDARMQDTAEGFGQPIRHVFEPFFAMDRQLPAPDDAAPTYAVTVGDRLWTVLYLPLAAVANAAANTVARLQQGRISTYLMYSFATLVLLLAFVL